MMSILRKKPILVTGSHRSGSTWMGKILSLAPDVKYIHEPFNPLNQTGICRAEFEYWFSYICQQNESKYLDDFNDCLSFEYHVFSQLKTIKSWENLISFFQEYQETLTAKFFQKRPLIKDPIAVFSAEWLTEKFDMDTVVLIRHPAAFAGSLKHANWRYPFDHFLKQPLLIEEHLFHFQSTIEEYARQEKNIIEQAILLWNLIYFMVLKYQKKHPDWIFIRHEDLSRNPVEEFQKIFNRLNLPFNLHIQDQIEIYSGLNQRIKKEKSLKRNSKANIFNWRTRLTPQEITLIQENTNEIASAFYSQEDWNGE